MPTDDNKTFDWRTDEERERDNKLAQRLFGAPIVRWKVEDLCSAARPFAEAVITDSVRLHLQPDNAPALLRVTAGQLRALQAALRAIGIDA